MRIARSAFLWGDNVLSHAVCSRKIMSINRRGKDIFKVQRKMETMDSLLPKSDTGESRSNNELLAGGLNSETNGPSYDPSQPLFELLSKCTTGKDDSGTPSRTSSTGRHTPHSVDKIQMERYMNKVNELLLWMGAPWAVNNDKVLRSKMIPQICTRRLIVVLVIFLVAAASLTWIILHSNQTLNKVDLDVGDLIQKQDETRLREVYRNYLIEYNKPINRLDDPIHREIFRQNWNLVIAHNEQHKQGHEKWSKAINYFTDMTEEERSAFENQVGLDNSTMSPLLETSSDSPQYLDYRKLGLVTSIKDEGSCASSFAFAVVAAMESWYAFLTDKFMNFSEQHVLDCGKALGDDGCKGGSLQGYLRFAQNVGVDTEANVPYKAVGDRKCKDHGRQYLNRIPEWKSVRQDEESMKEALINHGPIIATLTVDSEFLSYGGGVFNAPNNTMPNHAVLIVGFGQENGTDVWYIKNSWGTTWGVEGFMTMERGVDLRRISGAVYAIVRKKNHG